MTSYPPPDYTHAVSPLDNCAPRPRFQEWFSWSFVEAVASAAGLVPEVKSIDHNLVDMTVATWRLLDNKARLIGLQLKSTYAPEFTGGGSHVTYDLDSDHYNMLLEPSELRRYLVVVVVPRPDDPLVTLQPDAAHLHAAGWWGRVSGNPTTNPGTQRVSIPTTQKLDATGLRTMLLDE